MTATITSMETMINASTADIAEARMATGVSLSCPMVGDEVGTDEVGKTVVTIVTSVLVKDVKNVEIEL